MRFTLRLQSVTRHHPVFLKGRWYSTAQVASFAPPAKNRLWAVFHSPILGVWPLLQGCSCPAHSFCGGNGAGNQFKKRIKTVRLRLQSSDIFATQQLQQAKSSVRIKIVSESVDSTAIVQTILVQTCANLTCLPSSIIRRRVPKYQQDSVLYHHLRHFVKSETFHRSFLPSGDRGHPHVMAQSYNLAPGDPEDSRLVRVTSPQHRSSKGMATMRGWWLLSAALGMLLLMLLVAMCWPHTVEPVESEAVSWTKHENEDGARKSLGNRLTSINGGLSIARSDYRAAYCLGHIIQFHAGNDCLASHVECINICIVLPNVQTLLQIFWQILDNSRQSFEVSTVSSPHDLTIRLHRFTNSACFWNFASRVGLLLDNFVVYVLDSGGKKVCWVELQSCELLQSDHSR